ncbi:hypothetical protein [Paracidovorax citrulli]
MTATVTFLIYRIEWHRRRAKAQRAARTGMPPPRLPCRIYWAEDAFRNVRARLAAADRPGSWREPCTSTRTSDDPLTDSD